MVVPRKKTPKARKPAAPPMKVNDLQPITDNQGRAFDAFDDDKNLLLIGSAGTGKTMISLYMGLTAIEDREQERVVIVRSIVPSRDPGFLPGTLKEKIAVYETPYASILSDLYGRDDAYTILKEKGKIEFLTTSFVRGTTIKNSVIIIDEIQNMRWSEVSSILTRVGDNCRVIVVGDHRQTDLVKDEEKRGIHDLTRVAERMESFSVIEFTSKDIVRSGFVKEFLTTKEELNIPD